MKLRKKMVWIQAVDKIKSLTIVTMILLSCNKSDITPENKVNHNDYWGCWTEATGKTEYYDLILTENESEPHRLEMGNDCAPLLSIGYLDIGVFRNDTLILDNGIAEYWCYIKMDTMYYSAYVLNASTEVFVK